MTVQQHKALRPASALIQAEETPVTMGQAHLPAEKARPGDPLDWLIAPRLEGGLRNAAIRRLQGNGRTLVDLTAAPPSTQTRARHVQSAAALLAALAGPALLQGASAVQAAQQPAAAVIAHDADILSFDDGLSIGAAEVKGDGLGASAPNLPQNLQGERLAAVAPDEFSGGLRIASAEVRGDGHLNKPGKKARHARARSTGSQALTDSAGLKWFINTDISFSTSSSASGAMSEASFTGSHAVTTSGGGTVAATLNDAFDGYQTLCVSLNNTVASCNKDNANFVFYNKNGPATLDPACPNNRQVLFPAQASGNISMQRKVFVPDNDSFARWLDIFTNTGGTPQTVTAVIANNLGSDSNTRITGSSNGNLTAEVADTWIASFQNYSGTTSTDVRLGHVFQGAGATVPLAGINFVDTDDNPYWGYTFTLQPGQTGIIMNFAVGQNSKAAAAAKAAELVALPPNTLQCLSAAEKSQLLNFRPKSASVAAIPIPTMTGWGLGALVVSLLGLMGSWLVRQAKLDVCKSRSGKG